MYGYPTAESAVLDLSRGGHGHLQRSLMDSFLPRYLIKVLTIDSVDLFIPSCINITVESASFSRKHGKTFSSRSVKSLTFTVTVFYPFLDTVFFKEGVYDANLTHTTL
ncbi:hypothetical protein NPIL_477001 [Nephila pilipes]|uniref:Uncharacterized protein n=1 Tax=Nephila pilipes TaxID=299642 RepID=A0A8X6MYY3_NEPPI|nr:hypothetical protein NPIL_477001 [Nephila pilipes]